MLGVSLYYRMYVPTNLLYVICFIILSDHYLYLNYSINKLIGAFEMVVSASLYPFIYPWTASWARSISNFMGASIHVINSHELFVCNTSVTNIIL